MSDNLETARRFVEAQKAGNADGVVASIAEGAVFKLPRLVVLNGREAITKQLTNADAARAFGLATWKAPREDGGAVKVTGTLPLTNQFGGYELAFRFDGAGTIEQVEQRLLPAPPLPPSNLKLTDEMKSAVNGSFENNTPILVAGVDATRTPRLTFRGTVQTIGDDKLGFWARNGSGDTVTSLDEHPRMTVMYRDPARRVNYMFYGNAWVTKDEAERRSVYDNSPALERASDPDVKGVAIIVELDKIEGLGPSGRVHMRRA